MKKLLFTILIFLVPIYINADYSVTNYRIDMTVLENGNLDVIEAFSMNGLYNGFEKTINYKGNYDGYKGSEIASIEEVKLYDADEIVLNEIRSIDFSLDTSIDDITINSNLFTKVNVANKGEYGVYTINKRYNGETYTIYNPSKMNKDFYINYTLNNLVVVHDDIAELAMNTFTKINENIDYLEIYIHIPNNDKLLKIWTHSKAETISEIIDNNTIKITASNLSSNTSFDFRIVFDKEAVIKSSKKSNEIVFDKIIEIENKLNDNANSKIDEVYEKLKEQVYNAVLKVENTHNKDDYENAIILVKDLKDDDFKIELLVKLMNVESKVERKYIITKVLATSCMGFIILGILIIIYQMYKKQDDKSDISLVEDSFKNITNKYPPYIVGYLLKKRVNKYDLLSSILKLINDKKIIFVQTKNKKDYKLIKSSNANLNSTDERLIKLIFDDSEEITISKFKKNSKNDYNNFINKYSNWHNSAIHDAIKENFYEDLLFYKIFGICVSIIGIVISALLLDNPTYFSPIITILICLASIVYFILFYKRTPKGNEQYYKFINFKKIMTNFGSIPENELKEIHIWNEYLIYAITLGCFEKLSKSMQIKIENLKQNSLTNDIIDFTNFKSIIKIISNALDIAMNKDYHV